MSDELYPPDRIPGCLPRKTLMGRICPMMSDRITVLPDDVLNEYKDQTLRHLVKTVLDQDGVGSCATESTAQSVMIARAIAGEDHVVLNPWFIYHTTSGGRDAGSSIDDNLAFARDNGIAPESVWPRSKGWRAEPSAEAVEAAKQFQIEEFYDIASVAEMKTALVLGFPVVYGSNGHSVCKIAANGQDVNSWGTDWGDGGFGVWASFSRVNWAYGAFAVRVASFKVPSQFSAFEKPIV